MIGFRKHPYANLEKTIGYSFKKRKLLEMALVHRSYRFENDNVINDNQRLEFLGDAVLGFITAFYFYKKFPDREEGGLTTLRSQLTSGKALAKLAADIHLGEYIKMGKGEKKAGGERRSSNLEDAIESLIGSVYLDGGLKAVQKIFKKIFIPLSNSLSDDMWADNPKGKLQEYSQKRWRGSPQYMIIHKHGPAHAIIFTVEARLNNGVKGTGSGANKREAEVQAAINVLKRLHH